MAENGSVSQLIADAKLGDEDAFELLHRRYRPRIVQIANHRLKRVPPGSDDAEDVAQRAFIDLYRSFRQGNVPDLRHRHELLALLSHIVVCRILNFVRAETAERRGGNNTRTMTGLVREFSDPAIGPAQEAILRDSYEFFLRSVPENLRTLAELHLAGFTNREIAAQLNCVERTVERKLVLLRHCWQNLANSSAQAGDFR